VLKLYDYEGAPNPRRVRMFAAEKGIELESVQVDIRAGEQRSPEFLKKNPGGKIPVLELDDGTCIGESVAICRYLEGIQPEPNLFGADPLELALVEMHHRRLELVLFNQIGVSWVNGPIVTKMAGVEPNLRAKEQSDAAVHAYYRRMNSELEERPFVAGERFTIADITAVVAVDFASALVGLKPEEDLETLWRWHEKISARPSASA
jgi:glutathione S-transferase